MASTLNKLVRRTLLLHRALEELVRDFSEDGLSSDERIFNRLLTNDWRLPMDLNGPHDQRYLRAVAWVDEFRNYVHQLREYCFYDRGDPESFSALPLNGNQRASADECLRKLVLQRQTLLRWSHAERKNNEQAKTDGNSTLRSQLRAIVDSIGVKAAAVAIECNRDTLEDFLAGKTKPRKRTMQLFHQYVLKIKASIKK
jgi:hypothetical protein